jgi:DNA replication factor GINS
MEISYDELRRIHRLEKNTSKLVEVEEDFIDSLTNFVEEEKKNYLESIKDMSHDSRAFNNLKRIVGEIFLMRKKKILNKALIASHTKESDLDHMASQEKEFFKKLVKVIEEYSYCYDCLFGEKEQKEQKSKLKILKDIPTFVGTDMKEYGPFKEGDIVELPSKVSKLFLTRKIAEKQ